MVAAVVVEAGTVVAAVVATYTLVAAVVLGAGTVAAAVVATEALVRRADGSRRRVQTGSDARFADLTSALGLVLGACVVMSRRWGRGKVAEVAERWRRRWRKRWWRGRRKRQWCHLPVITTVAERLCQAWWLRDNHGGWETVSNLVAERLPRWLRDTTASQLDRHIV